MLEEVERRCIEPMQIVEEQRERVLRPGERADEPPEHKLEAVLRISRRQVCDGRLFPDDEFQLRNEADDQLAVRLDSLRQRRTPLVQLGFAPDEDLTDQAPQGL